MLAAMPRPVVAAALLLAACTTDLPHRWVDPEFGFTVRSDFEPTKAELLFRSELNLRLRALCAAFGVPSLAAIEVFVHDQDAIPHGGADIAGWHDQGAVHVLAAWSGSGLGLPDPASTHLFAHELVHALCDLADVQPPRWLEEGLCEVLASAPIAADGRIVAMPYGPRERELLRLRAQSRWLTVDALLALRAGYPADTAQMPPMYAQSTSFAAFLLARERTVDRSVLVRLAAMDDTALRSQFAAWEQTLDLPLSARLEPFAAAAEPAVRTVVTQNLGPPDGAAWWRIAARLLADAEPAVRTAARLPLLYQIPLDADGERQARAWSTAADAELRRSGLIALAQNGDLDAAIAFCRSLREPGAVGWWQPALWVSLLVPIRGAPMPAALDLDRIADAQYLGDHGEQLAQALARLRPELQWLPAQRRWQRR